jgi:serine/threonine-protein kinase
MLELSGYEIRGLLGAGGMGEVHRAYDKRLGREVAVKRLPATFLSDPDRLARFEREARVLASLNHPNIAAIYGIEDTSSDTAQPSCALILELVDGPTLADRIARGPLKIAEATDLGLQIARALEAAHESGIVHRDHKPANIKVTPQGAAKVLDFGLATPVQEASTSQTALSTVAGHRTQSGTIMGTPPYMSPEQLRGLPVDRRTDIWAFGCVLFEMLTGKPAFSGPTTSDIVATVLERDPDWASLPAALPDAVKRVLRWALVKDAHRRLRHIGDAILELEGSASSTSRGDTAPAWRRWPIVAALVAATVVGTIIGAIAAIRSRPARTDTASLSSTFTIAVGASEVLPRLAAISPDGRYIAYIAGPSGNQRAYLRRVGDRQSRVLAELPLQSPQPFFSPDSQWVAYFDAGKLKKAPVGGGAPITLADAPTPRGGTWVTDDSIVFAPISRGGLMTLPAAGGAAQVLTTPETTRAETSHRNPAFAPQSDVVLFVADGNGRSVQAVSLRTKKITVLFQGDGATPRYLPTGHMAYLLDRKLVAVPFDLDSLRITGSPFTVVDGAASFSFSDDGTLIYDDAAPSNILASTLVWVNRDGSVSPLPLRVAQYDHPRLSPDGRSIIVYKQEEGDRNLWLYDIARDTLSKFTLTSPSDWPVWTGDGRSVIYGSSRAGTQYDIFSKPVDGSNAERTLLSRPLTQIPRAAARSADVLILEETYADKPNALWRMSLRQPGQPQPLFDAPAGEMMPTLSPDGRWMGYVSSRSGRNEVYVRPATGTGSTWPISNDGGAEPVWSANGRELFYRENDKMVVVDVTASESLSFGKPRTLFEGSYMFGKTEGQEFDVSPDSSRFLMLKPQQPLTATPLNVRVNWFDELRQHVPK